MSGVSAARRWLAAAGVLAVITGAYLFLKLTAPSEHTLAQLPSTKVGSPDLDPLDPERPPKLLNTVASGAPRGALPVTSAEAWVGARPSPRLLEERKPSARGGVDPCRRSDPGLGDYLPGQMRGGCYIAVPRDAGSDGTFDVVMHFHGHELALNEFLRARSRFVFVGMTASRYADRLSDAGALDRLVELAEQEVGARTGRSSRAGRVVLAAWSGGYAAISLVLERCTRKPDAVVLLDGLHGSRDRSVLALQLDPIVRFARSAMKDEVFMYVSHSSVDTDGFASSTEGVHFLLYSLGVRPLQVEREDPLGMRLVELFSRGGFHSRGYAGGGKSDHCAHLSLYPAVLRALEQRWPKHPAP